MIQVGWKNIVIQNLSLIYVYILNSQDSSFVNKITWNGIYELPLLVNFMSEIKGGVIMSLRIVPKSE